MSFFLTLFFIFKKQINNWVTEKPPSQNSSIHNSPLLSRACYIGPEISGSECKFGPFKRPSGVRHLTSNRVALSSSMFFVAMNSERTEFVHRVKHMFMVLNKLLRFKSV